MIQSWSDFALGRALQVTRKVDILTPLGALYYNTGRYEEALQVYREAAGLQPDSTDIWLALVTTYTTARKESIIKAPFVSLLLVYAVDRTILQNTVKIGHNNNNRVKVQLK